MRSPSTPPASTRSSSRSGRTRASLRGPLARIASGGELSRVALAVKQVLAEVDETPTLVFDEIDTGIGGRSADPVGRSLWVLARDHQVLCVTHLPQIAAYADAHYRIAKRERDGRTVTEVTRLSRTERETELAQMIGGPRRRRCLPALRAGAAGPRRGLVRGPLPRDRRLTAAHG